LAPNVSITKNSGGIIGNQTGTISGCFYAPVNQSLTNTSTTYGTKIGGLANTLNDETRLTTTNVYAWNASYAWNFDTLWTIGHITKDSVNYKLPILKSFSHNLTFSLDESNSIIEYVLYGSDFVLLSPEDYSFENEGTIFQYWLDEDEVLYNAGAIMTPNKSMVLTAYWEIAERTITLTCTNFENQSFGIYLYKDGVLQNQYVGQGTLTLVLSQGNYTFQYVFTYIGKLEIASNSNVQIFDRKVNLINFVDTTIYYTISTPKINSAIVI